MRSIGLAWTDQVEKGLQVAEAGLVLIAGGHVAVLLNRSRNQAESPPVELNVDAKSLAVRFDPAWLRANPLTVADLEREQRLLAQAGYELSYG